MGDGSWCLIKKGIVKDSFASAIKYFDLKAYMMNRLEQLQTLLQENPGDAFLLFAIAKEYEKIADRPQALVYYQRVVRTDPDYVGVYYHLAKLYEKIEQPEKALEIYATGMDIARRTGDQHALAELSAAKLNLEMGEGDY